MPVYAMTRYPREVKLRDGRSATLRPMTAADAAALHALFLRVPEDERYFLKDDVTDPAVIEGWAAHLDYDRALPLLAVVGDRIVADATLIRRRGGARHHTAEIRIASDPEYRGGGLGTAMLRELIEIAHDAELEQVVFEMVKDVHDEVIGAIRALGAVEAGVVTELVKDRHGRAHDVVFMMLPLGKWWEWSQY